MQKLLNLLLDEVKLRTEGLVNNPAPTLELYNRRIGEIQGINFAIGTLSSLIDPEDEN